MRTEAYKLNNGTNNLALGKHSIAFGQGCLALGDEQTVMGRYPLIYGDTSTDALIIGGGRHKNDRYNALRVLESGEVQMQGGGEVYMKNPDTADITHVYMLGSNNRLKKVYLSR